MLVLVLQVHRFLSRSTCIVIHIAIFLVLNVVLIRRSKGQVRTLGLFCDFAGQHHNACCNGFF